MFRKYDDERLINLDDIDITSSAIMIYCDLPGDRIKTMMVSEIILATPINEVDTFENMVIKRIKAKNDLWCTLTGKMSAVFV